MSDIQKLLREAAKRIGKNVVDAYDVDLFDRLEAAAEAMVVCTDDRIKKYEELLYAVQCKHPGETRHETALRYIQQAESSDDLAKEQGHE